LRLRFVRSVSVRAVVKRRIGLLFYIFLYRVFPLPKLVIFFFAIDIICAFLWRRIFVRIITFSAFVAKRGFLTIASHIIKFIAIKALNGPISFFEIFARIFLVRFNYVVIK